MVDKYTPLNKHTKVDGKLKTPLSQFNIEKIQWEKDFLPEHLWFELLFQEYGFNQFHIVYNKFMDKLDETVNDDQNIQFGFLTDFKYIPLDKRQSFIDNNKELIYEAFYKPIGKILTLYPDNPAKWLVLEEFTNEEKIDFETELNKLGESVKRLLKAKDLHTGHIRALPVNRSFKHNKLFLYNKLEVTKLIPKYPVECNEDEKYRVQSFARTTMNQIYMTGDRYKDREWSKYFWRHNYDLIPCAPIVIDTKGNTSEIYYEQQNGLNNIIKYNIETVINYLNKLGMQYRYDLYDPQKDEILLGLFSRITRLYIIFLSDLYLWSRDLSGIFLRCIVDTLITFAFLIRKGTEQDFKRFVDYSDGKEKLLLLHLQDTFKNDKSIHSETYEQISDKLGGGIITELTDIDLSSWSKKKSRNLAKLAGLERYYKLVYDPASADIHGTWHSLKNTNLTYCQISLHRYHRLPSYIESPLILYSANLAQELYDVALKIGNKEKNFPVMDNNLKNIIIQK